MRAVARARHIRQSPYKVRVVLDQVRGLSAADATVALQFSNRRAAEPILKCLRSAVANMNSKFELGEDLDTLARRGYVGRGLRRRGHDHQALPASGPGPGYPDPQTYLSYNDRDCRRAGGDRLMGQKTHPYGFRLGIVTDWKSRWYSEKDYTALANEDYRIRDYLGRELKRGAVSRGGHRAYEGATPGRRSYRTARGGDRPQGKRGRADPLRYREDDGSPGQAQHHRGQGSGDRRPAAGPRGGRPAREPGGLPARHAANRPDRAQGRCRGRTGRVRGPSGRRRHVPGASGTARVGCRFIPSGPISTTARPPPAPRWGPSGVKVWVYKGDVVTSLKTTREKIAAEAALAGRPAGRAACDAGQEPRRATSRRAPLHAGHRGGRRETHHRGRRRAQDHRRGGQVRLRHGPRGGHPDRRRERRQTRSREE